MEGRCWEVTQRLRAQIALPEDQGSVPSTHTHLTTPCSSTGPRRLSSSQIRMYAQHSYTQSMGLSSPGILALRNVSVASVDVLTTVFSPNIVCLRQALCVASLAWNSQTSACLCLLRAGTKYFMYLFVCVHVVWGSQSIA